MGRIFTPRILAAAALASGMAAAACASIGPPALSSDLAGTRWLIQLIDGRPAQAQQASVEFAAEDRISGTAGCNSFSGLYEAADGQIAVRALGHTEMACDTRVMRQEETIISLLDNAEHYARQGDRLVITAEDGRNLVLTPLAS